MRVWTTISIILAILVFVAMTIVLPSIRGLQNDRGGFNFILAVYLFYTILVVVNGFMLKKILTKK